MADARAPLWLGLDGARAGWAAVALDGTGRVETALVASVHEALVRWPGAQHAFVDIPIGLTPGPDPRACDMLARQRLAPRRRSSVFPAPARAALDAPDHPTASMRNRDATGKGLSLQAFHLLPKIREVDALLRARPQLRPVVLESHPEILFVQLAERAMASPPVHPKRTPAGRAERLTLLAAHVSEPATAIPGGGGGAGADDWVDALVLAVAARMAAGRPDRIPDPPERDGEGLEMALALIP